MIAVLYALCAVILRQKSLPNGDAVDVLADETVAAMSEITVGAWDVRILEEQ